ncbi:MAG TPA: CHAD domain-containing protein [Candidatus Angelobacter sp.]|jgi:CHAD domain-containing protein|nr:CHAD domain-containing protein [Candidatus Angelobacter sp.]
MNSTDQRKKNLFQDFSRIFYKLRAGISPKKVHRLRTTIRRIESFVDLSGSKLGHKHKEILEELTDLRKRAGRVRNFDVQVRLLGSIANGSTISDRRILVQIFKAKRERQSRRLSSMLKKLDKAELVGRLEKLIGKTNLPGNSLGPIDPLERAKGQLLSLIAEVPGSEDLKPRRLHELRISLKKIRYTIELAEASAAREHLLETLKSVQDAIGEWHDWENLVKIAEKQFGDRVNCPLLVEMRALFTSKYSAARSAAVSLRASFAPSPKKQPRSTSSASRQARLA